MRVRKLTVETFSKLWRKAVFIYEGRQRGAVGQCFGAANPMGNRPGKISKRRAEMSPAIHRPDQARRLLNRIAGEA